MALFTNGKSWPSNTMLLTANGGANGILTVATTLNLRVGQRFVLKNTSGAVESVVLFIVEILSQTTLIAGPTMRGGTNLSAYTLALGATLSTINEAKNVSEASHIFESVYDGCPSNGLRVVTVDTQGNYVDSSGSGATPLPVPLTALTEISPQYNRLAFGSVTGTNAGTANAIITLNADRSILQVVNSLNSDTSLTYGGVEYWRLEAGDSFIIDLRPSALKLLATKVIGIFYNVVPTSGSIRVTAI